MVEISPWFHKLPAFQQVALKVLRREERAAALERVKKYCGHPAGNIWRRVFWRFGFFSAQSQSLACMLLRQSPAKTPKILAQNGYSIFLTAL
jgi:hypothetical protein